MNKFLMFFLVFGLVLSSSSYIYSNGVEFYSPTYFTQPNNDYDPLRFLENEDIIFEVCEDVDLITEMSGKIICDSISTNIKLVSSHNSNCFIGQIKSVSCEESELELTYKGDGKSFTYKRDLIKTQESEVIDYVLSENYEEITDPLELSYYLIVHNEINGFDETSTLIYEQLRDLRNNNLKCWPKDSCDIEITTEILHNLKIAGYNKDTRLLEDGEIYLNSNVRGESIEEGSIRVEFDLDSLTDVNCVLYTDGKLKENETFDEDTNFSKENFDQNFSLSCDRDIDEILLIIEDPIDGNSNRTLNDERDFDYEMISRYCYGKSSCDVEASLYALLTYGNNLDFYNDVLLYVENLTRDRNDNQRYILSSSNTQYSSMYLDLKQNEDIGNYVKFTQNNDGSWGTSSTFDNRIQETYWGLIGLDNVQDSSEHILDAQNWIYFEEPESGWNTLEQNALAYLSIKKFIRPFLVLEYEQELNGSYLFILRNPSIFPIQDVEVNFDSSVEKYVEYSKNIGEIGAKSEVKINVTSNNNILSTKGGNLIVKGVIDDKEEELLEAPVVISTNTVLNIEKINHYYSFDFPVVNIEIENLANLNLQCSIEDSLIGEKKNVELIKGINTISLKNQNLISGNSIISLTCNLDGDSIEYVKEIEIKEKERTFEIEEILLFEIVENFYEEKLIIKSISNETQDISLSFEDVFVGVVNFEEPTFTLREGDEKTIYFEDIDATLLESFDNSSDQLIISSSLGYSQKFSFTYIHTQESPLSIILIIIAIVGLILIGLVGFRMYQLRSQRNEVDEYDENEEFDFEELELN